jgi:hypothetical protein
MNPEVANIVMYYLVNRQQDIKSFSKVYQDQMNKLLQEQPKELHDDIKKQFKNIVVTKMSDDITKDQALPIEDVLIMLNDLNLDEYLK